MTHPPINEKVFDMTDQEMYDKVARHLLAQGEKSIGCAAPGGNVCCMYRGRGGRSCAIGCLIPDEAYSEDLELAAVTNKEVQLAAGISEDQVCLASDLQYVHDNVEPRNWPFKLALVAKRFGLRG